ncbi:MAG: NAD(+) kinase [Gammaproteobacteria bacterium]|nr:NAD(+) kinase [Gammaproteobacteria bacterium]
MSKFSSAGLIVKVSDASVSSTLAAVVQHLQDMGLQTVMEHSTDGMLDGVDTVDIATLGSSVDVAVVIGGDGTLLSAARGLVDYQVPLIGINRGRLGFLVDVPPDGDFNDLTQILNGEAISEERFLLEAKVMRDGEIMASSYAFNDVVVRVKDLLQIMDFDILIDDRLVTHQRADGVIIATPSGSTAYSLSNGGPIVGPSIDAVVLQPICPHTLTSRPLMVDASSSIRVHLWDADVTNVQVICDGQVYSNATLGDMIEIKCKQQRITLLHPPSYDYHQILREKLNWG